MVIASFVIKAMSLLMASSCDENGVVTHLVDIPPAVFHAFRPHPLEPRILPAVLQFT
jgi:hypothetical protein